MQFEQFSKSVEHQIQRSQDTLIEKAREYATDEDRLANFKAAAAVQGISVTAAIAGMMAKHTYSVYAMARSDEHFTPEQWNEKIGDHINYLLLLRAAVEEDESDRNAEVISEGLETLRRDKPMFKLGHTRGEYIFESEEKAEEVLTSLHSVLTLYGKVAIADLYNLVNIPPVYQDEKVGWRLLDPSSIDKVDNGYRLILPEPKPISY